MSKIAAMKASIKRMAEEAEAKKNAPVATGKKTKRKEKSPPREVSPPGPPKPRPNTRLPHGSKFEATYTAVAEDNGYWECMLSIPVNGAMERWHTRVWGIMASFPKLDRMYRAWLKSKKEKGENQTAQTTPEESIP